MGYTKNQLVDIFSCSTYLREIKIDWNSRDTPTFCDWGFEKRYCIQHYNLDLCSHMFILSYGVFCLATVVPLIVSFFTSTVFFSELNIRYNDMSNILNHLLVLTVYFVYSLVFIVLYVYSFFFFLALKFGFGCTCLFYLQVNWVNDCNYFFLLNFVPCL